MANPLRNLIEVWKVRVLNLAARAVIKVVNDATKMQELQLQVLSGETREGVERLQEYGFTSVPHEGAEAAAIFLGGNRDHGLVIATDDRRYRLKALQTGEVALYDDLGNVVKLGRTHVWVKAVTRALVEAPDVDVEALSGVGTISARASTSITLTAPNINLVGNILGGPAGGSQLDINASEAKIASPTHSVTCKAATVDVV